MAPREMAQWDSLPRLIENSPKEKNSAAGHVSNTACPFLVPKQCVCCQSHHIGS